jgi:NADH-quinone oxidoreductase subunit E
LHLAQEQDGHLTDDAMVHIGDLVGVTPAEVLGTASFYEMFKMEPVGRYMVNICTNISCQLMGGEELLEHAESTLGIRPGQTTADGLFTIEDVECIAACTEAPCLQVNYRYFHKITNNEFDELVAELRSGARSDIPAHGTLAQVRQHIPADRLAGSVVPENTEVPVWLSVSEDGNA